ncbi:MAG: multicopper oxidase domain-containing protein, partial [Myxococcota bacterium]
RIRLVNVSNVGYLSLDGIVAIEGDQGLLSAVQSVVRLPPGDRAGLLWTGAGALQTEPWSMVGPGVGPPQTLFSVQREGSAPEPSADWPTSGEAPTPDPGRTDLRYTFTGSPTAGWEINGQTWPEIEPDRFTLGDSIVLEIRNPSPAHHPFHLHGLEFEVLSVDGVAPATRRIEDTFDVGIRQTVRLLVEADNPGEWMSHCHILPHARQGMMTILSVSE